MAKTIHDQAVQHAQRSHDALVAHIEHLPWNDPLFGLVARALTDARIEGLLAGMALVADNIELDAYSRGYIDGRKDTK
jgi:hypothetical protein